MGTSWRPLVGEELGVLEGFTISDHGEIRSYWKPGSPSSLRSDFVVRQPARDEYGRLRVALRVGHKVKRTFLVHRLVAYTYLGAPPTDQSQVIHLNHRFDDNRATNLQWANPAEVFAHSELFTERRLGGVGGRPTLTPTQAAEVRSSRLPVRSLALKYNIDVRTVTRIRAGVYWSSGNPIGRPGPRPRVG